MLLLAYIDSIILMSVERLNNNRESCERRSLPTLNFIVIAAVNLFD